MNTLKTFMKDENGSQFIENGLWIALVVLTLAAAGLGLANKVNSSYNAINGKVDDSINKISEVKLD